MGKNKRPRIKTAVSAAFCCAMFIFGCLGGESPEPFPESLSEDEKVVEQLSGPPDEGLIKARPEKADTVQEAPPVILTEKTEPEPAPAPVPSLPAAEAPDPEILKESAEILEKIREQNTTLEARNEALQEELGNIRSTIDNLGTDRAKKVDPRETYRQALTLFEEREYEAARKLFRGFLAAWPGHSLSDNAGYWIGECHYAQGEYEKAAIEFRRVLSDFEDSNKIPDALLKLGLCHYRQKEKDKAAENWLRVKEEFPKTGAAQLARKYLGWVGRR